MNIPEYFDLLQQSTDEAIATARAIPADQLHQADEGCWSPLGVLEHVCLTEALVIKLMSRPSAELHPEEVVHGSSKLQHLVVNKRQFKIAAPERLHPKGTLASLEDFERVFTSQRADLKDAIEGGTVAVDNRLFPHPVFGPMTVSDWLYFLVHHTQRHVEQLKEKIAATA